MSLQTDYHVIIDAGHGWFTEGKRSKDGSLREKEYNSSVQAKVGLLLEMEGISYDLIADGMKDVSLANRVKKEHEIFERETEKGKIVIGISIHADAFGNESANGFTTFHFSDTGKQFAENIHEAISESNTENDSITKDRGVRHQTFYMLRKTKGIWILLEGGFMTNDSDLKHLKSDSYRNDMAIAILEGLYNYAD